MPFPFPKGDNNDRVKNTDEKSSSPESFGQFQPN